MMNNCIILGSGRSGTSMVAGALYHTGYFMGESLYSGNTSNQKGFFESWEINSINEIIIERALPRRLPILDKWFYKSLPDHRQRWLARISLEKNISGTPELFKRIDRLVSNIPFCFKDPRFSYTLPVWEPFFNAVVYICVFRDPASTAKSILRECNSRKYLKNFIIDFNIALEIWNLMYLHILEKHSKKGEWLFLHFNQMMHNQGLDRLEQFVQAKIDRSFPNPNLRTSYDNSDIPTSSVRIYGRLCELAGYTNGI